MKKSWWKGFGERIAPYMLLSPFLFTLVVFFGYAFVRVVYFSFMSYDLFTSPTWVGLKNYVNIFKDVDFTRALQNSFTFMIVVTTCQTILALLLAVVLNQKIRGIKYFRALYYMPSVASSVVVTLIFVWFFQRRGVLNFLLTKIQEYGYIFLGFLVLAGLLQSLLVAYERWRKFPVSLGEPSFLFLSLLVAFMLMFFAVRFGILSPREVTPVDTILVQYDSSVAEFPR